MKARTALHAPQRHPAQAAWNAGAAQGVGYYAESNLPSGMTVLTSANPHTQATYSSASTIAPQITNVTMSGGNG